MGKKMDPKEAEAIMLNSGFKPLEPYKNSRTKWRCRCITCKKISFPMLKHVKFYGTRCRYCVGTLVDEEDATKVMIKNGFKPLVPYPKGNKPWKSECKICKKISSPTYSHVIQRGHCCKYCAPNAIVLADKAITAFQAGGFEVIGNYKNTKTAVKVRCVVCKQIVNKAYEDLMQGTGCSVCAGNLPLDKAKAIEFFLDNNLKPLEAFINVNNPWKSRCLRCKKIVSPTYGAVKQGKSCGYCSGNLIDPKDAVKNMISWGYRPKESYKENNHNWKCIHIPCGNIVTPRYAQIQQGFGGCRYCAEWGFQYDKPSYLYLITHPHLNAHKIGIGNVTKAKADRLYRLKREGWKTIQVWKFEEGKKVMELEKAVFKVVRKDLKLPIHLSKEQMKKTEGHSETIDADSITLLQLEKIINKVIRGMKNG